MNSLHDIWRGDIIPESGVDVAVGRNSLDPPSPVVPLLDVHLRREEFHDVDASGIVSFHAEKNRLELIPSNSGAQPIVTAVLFDAYNSTGGTSVTSSSTELTIDTERINTHPDIYSLDSDQVTIHMSGVYEIEYRATLNNDTGSTRTTSRAQLDRQDPGGSFTEVTASRSFGYNRNNTTGRDSLNAKVILENIAPDTKFRVSALIVAGATTLNQIPNATSMTIKKLA